MWMHHADFRRIVRHAVMAFGKQIHRVNRSSLEHLGEFIRIKILPTSGMRGEVWKSRCNCRKRNSTGSEGGAMACSPEITAPSALGAAGTDSNPAPNDFTNDRRVMGSTDGLLKCAWVCRSLRDSRSSAHQNNPVQMIDGTGIVPGFSNGLGFGDFQNHAKSFLTTLP